MNRPYIEELGGWGCYPRQKYFFPHEGPDGLRAWYKVLEVLCDDERFHEVLAKHGITVVLHPDWRITFEWGGKVDGPRYSRLLKAMWDNFQATFQDFGMCLKNRYEIVGADIRDGHVCVVYADADSTPSRWGKA